MILYEGTAACSLQLFSGYFTITDSSMRCEQNAGYMPGMHMLRRLRVYMLASNTDSSGRSRCEPPKGKVAAQTAK